MITLKQASSKFFIPKYKSGGQGFTFSLPSFTLACQFALLSFRQLRHWVFVRAEDRGKDTVFDQYNAVIQTKWKKDSMPVIQCNSFKRDPVRFSERSVFWSPGKH